MLYCFPNTVCIRSLPYDTIRRLFPRLAMPKLFSFITVFNGLAAFAPIALVCILPLLVHTLECTRDT